MNRQNSERYAACLSRPGRLNIDVALHYAGSEAKAGSKKSENYDSGTTS